MSGCLGGGGEQDPAEQPPPLWASRCPVSGKSSPLPPALADNRRFTTGHSCWTQASLWEGGGIQPRSQIIASGEARRFDSRGCVRVMGLNGFCEGVQQGLHVGLGSWKATATPVALTPLLQQSSFLICAQGPFHRPFPARLSPSLDRLSVGGVPRVSYYVLCTQVTQGQWCTILV